MKMILPCLLLLWWSGAYCQTSPMPVINSFAGTSLPAPWSGPDSAFCKGGVFEIAGTDFLSTNGGEVFDSVTVHLGTVRAKILTVIVGDTLRVEAPDSFPNDTTLMLTLSKHTQFGSIPHQYDATFALRLVGDHARIEYPAGPYCLGSPNPVPSMTIGGTTTGGFCCWTSGGFSVLPTGEIPLHSGALGNHDFLWAGAHPVCPDTLRFTAQIDSVFPATAFIGGLTGMVVCHDASALVVDSVGLSPIGGLFFSPSGLVVTDDSLGVVDVGASPLGMHDLVYTAPGCYDPAVISIEILAVQTATLLFPISGLVICPDFGLISPVFLSGPAGGTWLSSPSGLALGSGGTLDAGSSLPGSYSVSYVPPGQCADTLLVASSLAVGVSDTAGFVVDPPQGCSGDSVFADSIQSVGVFILRDDLGAVLSTMQGNGQSRQFMAENLAAGNYNLSQVTGGDCPDTLTRSFSILPLQDPSFSYPPNNLFCLADADPFPVISGVTGGTFSAITSSTELGNGGMLALSQSGPGVHLVQYLSPGPCADSSVVSVTVLSSPDATFSYPASQFCASDSNPLPMVATIGGSFSAPSGLSLDSVSGEIKLSASTAGSYAVTHTLSGGCASSFTLNVQILDTGSATTISYPNPLCQGSAPVSPDILGDSAGSFSASAGLVFSPFNPGAVDLLASQAGSYVVHFTPDNPCADIVSDTLIVTAPLDASFAYDTNAHCKNGSDPVPEWITHPGGTFSATPGLTVDVQSGAIDLNLSLSDLHTVYYTSPGPCPATEGEALRIISHPTSNIMMHPGNWFCEGIPVTIEAGGGVNFAFLHNGSPVDAGFDSWTIDSLEDGDEVSAIAWNALGCSDTITETVHVKPLPEVLLMESDTIATGDALVDLTVMATVDGTQINLEMIEEGDVYAVPPNKRLSGLEAGEVWETSFHVYTHDRLDPAWLWLVISAHAEGCSSEPDSVRLWVTPETDIWIAEVITPNGDGVNDTWKMLIPGISDPMDYELSVFNRSGGKVAALTPPNQDWGGAGLPDGVYWWVLRDLRDKRELQSGGLTIRRK